jgi:N-acetylglutamate synthase-like GNAT family acetyltransferase
MGIRNAKPEDAATCAGWLREAENINLVDRGVYEYPTCQTLVVERKEQPVLINSFHAVLVMEALAPKPGISPMREAWALNELFEEIKAKARSVGVKEIMFGCKDERLEEFIKERGFEKLSFPVFRFKL